MDKKDLKLFDNIEVTQAERAVGSASIIDDENHEAYVEDAPYVPMTPQGKRTAQQSTETPAGSGSWGALLDIVKNVDSEVVSTDASRATMTNSLINLIACIKNPSSFTKEAEAQEWFRKVGYDKNLIVVLEKCLSELRKLKK